MKLREIINHYNNIAGINGNNSNPDLIINKTLPPKLEYALSRNMKNFEEEIRAYIEEREKILKSVCEKDENGKPLVENNGVDYKINEESAGILEKEIEDLLDTEVDIEIRMVHKSILEQCAESDRYHIPSTKEIMFLDFMIKEE